MRELICIICPRGCHLTVSDDNKVSGNYCPRGAKYALEEIVSPKRTITSTVLIKTKGGYDRAPVKTSDSFPKERIFDVMKEINKVRVVAPKKIGDIVIKNVLDLGVDIVITKDME